MREQLGKTVLAISLVTFGAAVPVRADLTPPPQEWAAKFSRVAWQSMETPPGALPALGNAFTLEAWIFLAEYPRSNVGIVLSRPPEGSRLDALYVTSSGQLGFVQGSQSGLERGPLPMHRWVHVAGILGSGTRRLYIDAVEVGSGANLGPSTETGAFEIGPRTGGGIAQVRIWNRALSAAELADNAGHFLTGGEQGLLAYWPLDDGGRSETARDLGPFHTALLLGRNTDFFVLDDRQPGWIPTADLANGPFFARKEIDEGLPGGLATPIDFDDDGDLDLICVGELQPEDAVDHPPWYVGEPPAPLTAFRNDGVGSFAEATNAVFAQSTQITGAISSFVADFTGDGRPDVFFPATGVEFFADQQNGVLPGDRQTLLAQAAGGQLHSEPQRFPNLTFFAHAMAVGDIDNDGDTDIFHGNQDNDCFGDPHTLALACPSIWVNDGHGFFTDDRNRIPSAVARQRSAAVALFDTDGDGDNDAWFGNSCEGCPFTAAQGQLLLNDGTGHFAFAPAGAFPSGIVGQPEHILTADVDLDGDIDLLESLCSQGNCRLFRLLLNRGNGTFLDGSAGLPSPTPTGRIHASDLNGDNLPEVTIQGNHPTTVLLNRGEGRFDFLPAILDVDGTPDYSSGDFDGDGDRELIADQWGIPVQYFENLKPYHPVVYDCGGGVPCPALPGGAWLSSLQVPGFRFKVQIGSKAGRQESSCIAETLCASGAVPGRPEVFLRIVGPKPNGFLWPTLVKFSTSQVEVWAEQTATGVRRFYRLAAVDPGAEVLDLAGLAHKEGFRPNTQGVEEARIERGDWTYEALRGAAETLDLPIAAALRARRVRAAETAPPPPSASWLTTSEIPGFRFAVRIGGTVAGAKEDDCIQETLCVSGAVPGRPEVFTRVVGPKPNGFLWPTLVKFSTSRIEVWVEKTAGGIVRYYDLLAVQPGDAFLALSGLADRKGFLP